ncbi:MAG: YncE family protein [Nitrosotalea sp.]
MVTKIDKRFIVLITAIGVTVASLAVFTGGNLFNMERIGNNSEDQNMTSTALQKIQTIPLSNVNGRIDHMDIDIVGGRLFIAELGNNSVDVIDLMKGKRIHSIAGLDEPQGIVFVPESKKIYVANAGDGTVDIFNSDSYSLIKTINLSSDADNMRYDSGQKLVYVGYGNGALGLIDTITDNLTDSIKLGGHPESFQISHELQPGIFVNVPGDDSIEVVGGQKLDVTTKISNTWAHYNYAMALDENNHRLFVVYRLPSQLSVIDIDTGKPVTKLNVVGDADDIFYDAKNKQIYVTGGEGYLQVISQDGANTYHEVTKIPTANGARTSLFVPETSRLYIAVPAYFGQEAQIQVYEIHKLS